MNKVLVIGAGFSGAVVARQLADNLDCIVDVWDERDHIAGNCHTERDPDTQILVHRYGPHIFNTNNELVWKYVNRFGELRTFTNRVKAVTERGVFSMPINLLTINQFFNKNLNPDQAKAYISALGDKTIEHAGNFEEQALKMIGRELYENFFKGYTIKQWGCSPADLPASILKRLPIRFNYEDDYYDKRFQGIPVDGYTAIISRILDHPGIAVSLGRRLTPEMLASGQALKEYRLMIYTGPIDAFFNFIEGRLGYRTVNFERVRSDSDDFQGNAVINYTSTSIPWTRIHEHKHFAPWEKHSRTVAFREYSKETMPGDIPYYPKRLPSDLVILNRYRDLARSMRAQQSKIDSKLFIPPVTFIGRLATYRYLDMETVIDEAIQLSNVIISLFDTPHEVPCFMTKQRSSRPLFHLKSLLTFQHMKLNPQNLAYAITHSLRAFRYLRHRDRIPYAAIAPYPPSRPVILEAGVSNGSNTVEIAEFWPDARVFGFEPVAQARELALSRTAGLQDRIKIFPYALGNARSTLQMHVSGNGEPAETQSSSLLRPTGHLHEYEFVPFKEVISVDVVRIDEWARENNVNRIDFMWLDLQGYELKALEGAGSLLDTLSALHIEVSHVPLFEAGVLYPELNEWLRSRGFRPAIDATFRLGGNVLFIRK